MNSDIRLDVDVFQHPKILELGDSLGPQAVLCLFRLWAFTAKYHPRGCLRGMEDRRIERAAGWEGDPGKWINRLADLKLVDGKAGNRSLHGWRQWQGYAYRAPERSRAAKIGANSRWSKRNNNNAGRMRRASESHAKRNAPSPAPDPAPSPDPDPDQNRRSKTSAQKPRWSPPASLPGFCEFWGLHPHRVEGAECEKVWRKNKLEPIAETINSALRAQLEWDKFQGEGVEFMKRAPSWLRKRRWEDEPPRQRNAIRELQFDEQGNLIP